MKENLILSLYQKSQTVFTLKEISLMFPGISYNNLKRRLSYYVRVGKLKKIRKGIYAKENYNPFELATKIYTPSYISLETVFEKEGIVFQKYKSIFVASYLTRRVKANDYEIVYRKLPEEILVNKSGLVEGNNYFVAIKERAFLDAVYLYKNYYFDNLKPLDWEKVMDLKEIYKSKAFERRVNDYFRQYQEENVQ
jgi:predicted transcriptional regulator of viral defense system